MQINTSSTSFWPRESAPVPSLRVAPATGSLLGIFRDSCKSIFSTDNELKHKRIRFWWDKTCTQASWEFQCYQNTVFTVVVVRREIVREFLVKSLPGVWSEGGILSQLNLNEASWHRRFYVKLAVNYYFHFLFLLSVICISAFTAVSFIPARLNFRTPNIQDSWRPKNMTSLMNVAWAFLWGFECWQR